MFKSPYDAAPDVAFWSRSVARNWTPQNLISSSLLRPTDLIASAGSCFAANIIPYLENAGYKYLRTERTPGLFSVPPETFGYEKFSASYGNIYTVRQLFQLLLRATGCFEPKECFWERDGNFIDPFRPGLRYHARSLAEFKKLTQQHLACVRRVFVEADVFIFTLGLTEAWLSTADGAVFPACPGTIAGSFDSSKHKFHNFTLEETTSDLAGFVEQARILNPDLRIILTVSPVPLVATASGQHVLEASTYSKSVLRVAAAQLSSSKSTITYFPAYEIITGPQAPHDFFERDRRTVSQKGIEEVMKTFLSGRNERMLPSSHEVEASLQELSRTLIRAECEELMADKAIIFSDEHTFSDGTNLDG
jgi:hypothetical protein